MIDDDRVCLQHTEILTHDVVMRLKATSSGGEDCSIASKTPSVSPKYAGAIDGAIVEDMVMGSAMAHDDRVDDAPVFTLADLAQMVDSPMLRTMSGENADIDTRCVLAAIAEYEGRLGLSA